MSSLLEIVYQAAREARHASTGTCSATGTTTTLVDLALVDVGVTDGFMQGAWILRPTASDADKVRTVESGGFNTTTGTFTVQRAWSVAPQSGEAYYLFTLAPPLSPTYYPVPGNSYSWQDACNDSLSNTYYLSNLTLGAVPYQNSQIVWQMRRSETTLIAAIAAVGGSGITITPPTGWTLIDRQDNGTDVATAVYRKRALATDTPTQDWTLSPSCAASIAIVPITGANATAPVRSYAGDTGSLKEVTFADATASPGDALLHLVGAATGAVVAPGPADVEVADASAWDGAAEAGLGFAFTVAVQSPQAGAATLGDDTEWASVSVSLKPLIPPQSVPTWQGPYVPTAIPTDIVFGAPGVANNGAGDDVIVAEMPAALPSDQWRPTREAVRNVWVTYPGAYQRQNWSYNGTKFTPLENNNQFALLLFPCPPTASVVEVEVHRPYADLIRLEDETDCYFQRAWKGAQYRMYQFLNSGDDTTGQYARELADARQDFESTDAGYRPQSLVTFN